MRHTLLLCSLLALSPALAQSIPPLSFVSDRNGSAEIYLAEMDGTPPQQLTFDSGIAGNNAPTTPDLTARMSWSPDGEQVAFGAHRQGSTDIYIMPRQGGELFNITPFVGFNGFPAWSPDGRFIAFVGRPPPAPGMRTSTEIYLIEPGGSPVEISQSPTSDTTPAWSPDGHFIAFASNRQGDMDIYLTDPFGSEPVNLTRDPAYDVLPSFSPDGSLIAFASYRDGNSDIFILDLAGGLRQLTFDPAEDSYPAWSPDGSHIAFVSDRDGNQEVYLINADGSGLVNFSQNPGFDASPVWLPMSQQTATAIKQASWGQVKNNPTAK